MTTPPPIPPERRTRLSALLPFLTLTEVAAVLGIPRHKADYLLRRIPPEFARSGSGLPDSSARRDFP